MRFSFKIYFAAIGVQNLFCEGLNEIDNDLFLGMRPFVLEGLAKRQRATTVIER